MIKSGNNCLVGCSLNRKGKILKLIYEEERFAPLLGYINGNVKEKRYGRERRECSFHLHLKEEKRSGGPLGGRRMEPSLKVVN
jgi:hypothetical protein